MIEHGMYFGKNSFYKLIRDNGGQWNDIKERPIVCLVKSVECSNLYWAIPVGNYEHRSIEAKQRIQTYMSYNSEDIRSCFYHIGNTNEKSIFFISDVVPITDKYIDREYLNKTGKIHIIKNKILLSDLEYKLGRILAFENSNTNYFRQHITDIKQFLLNELKENEKSNNCSIRKWKLEDKEELAKNLNNKKVLDNLRDGLPYPYTEKDAEEYIKAMLSADEDDTFAFAITVDDVVIGSIGVFRRDNIHFRTAEMGYYIGEDYWGKGYMTYAVKQVCKYVFDNTDIIRIFAEPFAYNIASCRVLEKSGFKYEGTLRSGAFKSGKVVDMKMYALLKVIEN